MRVGLLPRLYIRLWAWRYRRWQRLNYLLWEDAHERATALLAEGMTFAEQAAFENGISINSALILSPDSPRNQSEHYFVQVQNLEE
jgi:hypothetical protein